MSLSFREYLLHRPKRYSPGSIFLEAVIGDNEFTAVTSREELEAYLDRRKIEPNGRTHAHSLWRHYKAAKKRHEAKAYC